MNLESLNVAIVSSEVFPFAKTGGLADVCGTLPVELAKLGHRPVVFMPGYTSIDPSLGVQPLGIDFRVPVGKKLVKGTVAEIRLPAEYSPRAGHRGNGADSAAVSVPVYLIQQDDYFGRANLYSEHGVDYADNCERFTFFCRGVMEAMRQLEIVPELIHANDWQTGLIPAYLRTELGDSAPFTEVATLFTIHNLAYQGLFWHWDMLLTGLDWSYFNWQQMEFYGQLNLLKTGIVFADKISTVSPRYAEEIQTDELGCGLQGVLRSRSEDLVGIMNGIDTEVWDPRTDPHLEANYGLDDWQPGKRANKAALQEACELESDPAMPLIGLVGRLAAQKGWSILIPILEQWLDTIDVQWVVLGTGEIELERRLNHLARRFPHRLNLHLTFSDRLAHQIEAASDMFLMPSQYEPCGLNQLYSLRYGSVPIVRATGGLADSITNATPETLRNQTANGFSFENFHIHDLETAIARAIVCYLYHPQDWTQIVETGMQQDWSWRNSALQYVELYRKAIRDRRGESVSIEADEPGELAHPQ